MSHRSRHLDAHHFFQCSGGTTSHDFTGGVHMSPHDVPAEPAGPAPCVPGSLAAGPAHPGWTGFSVGHHVGGELAGSGKYIDDRQTHAAADMIESPRPASAVPSDRDISRAASTRASRPATRVPQQFR